MTVAEVVSVERGTQGCTLICSYTDNSLEDSDWLNQKIIGLGFVESGHLFSQHHFSTFPLDNYLYIILRIKLSEIMSSSASDWGN